MSKLLEYAPEICQIAKEKGFWKDGVERNKGEMVMLIISELGECLEAHRKVDHFDTHDTNELTNNNYSDSTWSESFKELCKDTVEDELADAVIRILDYVYGWKVKMYEREYRKESTGNFGHDLLRITWYCLQAFHGDHGEIYGGMDWGYVLAAIEKFAEWYNINLEQHVQWKMKYNSTRQKLHGKAY